MKSKQKNGGETIKHYWTRPNDVREWLIRNNSYVHLAEAIAHVQNLLGDMLHDLADDDYWLFWSFDEWTELNDELTAFAIRRMSTCSDPINLEANIDIKQYMKRFGYVKSDSWWIRDRNSEYI